MSDSAKEFGAALKEERKSRGLTLEEMASILGTSKQVLSRYERGERECKLSTAIQFSEALGSTVSSNDDAISNDSKKIGELIHSVRKRKGLTLLDVGNAIGVSKATVSRYENGIITDISFLKIPALCKILGITPNQLFGWDAKEEIVKFSEIKRSKKVMDKTPQFEIYDRSEWSKFSKIKSITTLTGFLYMVEVGDLVKIGKSINPYGRVANLRMVFENYGDKKIGLCAISEEHKNYTMNEKILHKYFAKDRIPKSELFKIDFHTSLKEIENGWTGITTS